MSIFDEYHMPRGELADSLASFIKKEVEEAPNWVYDADAKKYNRFDTATGCNQTWG